MIAWTNPPDVQHRIDRIERQAKITALWLVVMLNLIFRDLHEIVKAEFLTSALEGIYDGMEVTEALFLLGGVMVAIPISMIALTWFLPRRINRWANIGVAAYFGALVLSGMWGDLDDIFHGGVELVALGTITHLARTWRPTGTESPESVSSTRAE